MPPRQRPPRRTRRPNGYVLLDRTWAQRLGVQRTGGSYRVGRRDLADRLTRLSTQALPLEDLAALESHAHAVGFYQTDTFLAGCVRDFLASSLLAGDGAILVATAAHRYAFSRALKKAGIDLHAVQRHGRYIALDASATLSTFMNDGMPDAARFKPTMGALISYAARGPRKVRIYGEMVAMLWDQGNVTAAIALERLWNDLAAIHPFSLLCAYPIRLFDTWAGSEQIQQVCAQHSKVIATVG